MCLFIIKKLMDYYESGCGNRSPVEEQWGIKRIPNYLMYSKRNVEQILGDTVFLVQPRLEWLDYPFYGKRIGTVWEKS